MPLIPRPSNQACLFRRLFAARWGTASLLLALMAGFGMAGTPSVLMTPEAIAKAGEKYGEMAQRRLKTWQTMIANGQGKGDMEKLEMVNNFFNLIPYKTDLAHWQQKDYWATPLEMLGSNGGDCEDYSIGKYLTLRQLGVDDEKLRITYVKYLTQNEAHVVLSYYPELDKEPYILDNINKRLLKASERKDLLPVYSFNGEGLWVAKGGGGGQEAGSSSRLQRWTDVKDKLAQGG
jgi:predicted transglutaminase-like cysteine proteinase